MRDFPGDPVARTPFSQCRRPRFLGQGTRSHMPQLRVPIMQLDPAQPNKWIIFFFFKEKGMKNVSGWWANFGSNLCSLKEQFFGTTAQWSAVVGNSGFWKLCKGFSQVTIQDCPSKESDWESIYIKESPGLRRQNPRVMWRFRKRELMESWENIFWALPWEPGRIPRWKDHKSVRAFPITGALGSVLFPH